MTRFAAWLDRHAGAIISGCLSILAATSVAGAGLLLQMSSSIGGLHSDVRHTSQSVQDLKATISGVYTIERAKEAHARIWQTDSDQYQRIQALEGQVKENSTRIDSNSVAIERLRSRGDS